MEKFRYSPIILSGPSGAGKTEIIDFIEKKDSTFLEATGSTTRQKREIETGRMYFISFKNYNNII